MKKGEIEIIKIIVTILLLLIPVACFATEFPSPEKCQWISIEIRYKKFRECYSNSLTIYENGQGRLNLRNGCHKSFKVGAFNFLEIFESLCSIAGKRLTPPIDNNGNRVIIMVQRKFGYVPIRNDGIRGRDPWGRDFDRDFEPLFFEGAWQDINIYCALFKKALNSEADMNVLLVDSLPPDCPLPEGGTCEECTDCIPCGNYL